MTDASPASLRNGLTRNLINGSVSSVGAKLVSMLAPLVIVPLALQALGVNGYGAWAAALAFTSFASFADLGLGASLMTVVPKALASNNYLEAKTAISSAYALLISVSAIGVSTLWLTSFWLDWAFIIGGSESAGDETVETIVLIALTGFTLNISFNLISRVQQAAQQVARSQAWQALGALVGLLGVFLASQQGVRGAWFVAIATFIPAGIAVVNSIQFFASSKGKPLRPGVAYVSLKAASNVTKVGLKFAVILLLMSAALGADTWIVAATSSLEDAAEFSITARVFAVIAAVVAAVAAPLWPTVSHALNSNQIDWAISATRKLGVVIVLLAVTLSLAGAMLIPWVFDWWLGGSVVTSPALLYGFVLLNVVQSCVSAIFMFQNGANVLTPQLLGYALLLMLAVPAKWIVSILIGFEYVVYVGAISYALLIWPAAYVGYQRSIRVRQYDAE